MIPLVVTAGAVVYAFVMLDARLRRAYVELVELRHRIEDLEGRRTIVAPRPLPKDPRRAL